MQPGANLTRISGSRTKLRTDEDRAGKCFMCRVSAGNYERRECGRSFFLHDEVRWWWKFLQEMKIEHKFSIRLILKNLVASGHFGLTLFLPLNFLLILVVRFQMSDTHPIHMFPYSSALALFSCKGFIDSFEQLIIDKYIAPKPFKLFIVNKRANTRYPCRREQLFHPIRI